MLIIRPAKAGADDGRFLFSGYMISRGRFRWKNKKHPWPSTRARQLTGETIKMLKEGMDKPQITELLYKHHIEPRLLHPENYPTVELRLNRQRTRGKHVYAGRLKKFPDFKTWKVSESEDKNGIPLATFPKDHPPLQ